MRSICPGQSRPHIWRNNGQWLAALGCYIAGSEVSQWAAYANLFGILPPDMIEGLKDPDHESHADENYRRIRELSDKHAALALQTR